MGHTIFLGIAAALAFAGYLTLTHRRLLRYLQFFQQEEYSGARFVAWWARRRAFDRRVSVACIVLLALDVSTRSGAVHELALLVVGVAMLALGRTEEDPRFAGKIRLNLTERARRILSISLLTSAFVGALWISVRSVWGRTWPGLVDWVALVVFVQLLPFELVLANAFLTPGERRRQRRFLAEAAEKIREVAPFTIGITGSYGKTSTKALLNTILSTLHPTFTMDRSINTLMGITREIRERLKPGHRYAVIEMGAYQRGSIRRLCELTPPNAAIITAVGIMHLERFGSPENVVLAKSELAQAVPESGILVGNGDDANVRRIAAKYPKKQTLFYGFDRTQPLDCFLTDVDASAEFTKFVLHWRGQAYPGRTALRGQAMLSNVMAAFVMACSVGCEPRAVLDIIDAFEGMENRLQIKRVGPIVEFRDAYNSNPVGFSAALDELKQFPAKRRILITPGMVELGEQQAQQNEAVARKAAVVCDKVILVGETNRAALMAGLKAEGFPTERLQTFATRDEAFKHLRQDEQEGDVVLIENDLPDLYDSAPRF